MTDFPKIEFASIRLAVSLPPFWACILVYSARLKIADIFSSTKNKQITYFIFMSLDLLLKFLNNETALETAV
ncbi:hypothetical protein NTG1052_170025 [Candidatus Nitrotoga sp. 1052]|nr:hypothetical protein NTG1052_170025 [Candidatus Nitrotoga sp. 1052]